MEKDTKDTKDTKDAKKKPAQAAPKKRTSPSEYMRGVRTEMKKVVWPTRKELGSFTAVVVMACTFFAIFFGAVDFGVIKALKVVLGISLNIG
ncbi:MAG: preprotein translocase subunit SecE [Clostridiales bacterium]|nr:preprotein translocase subunit SecE [Clostridiales bacterium]